MKKNKILLVILIMISCFQSIILYNINKFNFNTKKVAAYKEELSIQDINEYENISNISDKIKNLNNVEFLEGKKQNDGSWIVEIKIDGKKEEILESLYKLKNYAIKNYKIEHNKDKSSLIIELNKLI